MAKEPKDILDENVIERLNGPSPTNRDIAEGVKLILRRLWSDEDLTEYIDSRLDEKCANCELRRMQVVAHDDAEDPDGGKKKLTRRQFLLEIVKAPWFWIPVATICALVCAKYGISLPVVGGAN